MSATSCPRLFEAEAVRDGRLTGAERASFERHAALCAACAREVRALEALGQALRTGPHDDAIDDLHVRRERVRLLAAFDRVLVAPERRGSARAWVGVAAAAAMLAVGFVVLRYAPPAPTDAAPSVVVRAEEAAVWSERREGGRERVVLERGVLRIHVVHAAGEGRLVVSLPDGELEDIGTTFTVSAEDGRTTGVTVHEGLVALRLRGRASLILGPGEAWTPDVPAPVACATTSSEPAPAPPPQPSSTLASARPSRSAAPMAPDAAADFRGAMDALDRGDNRTAATAFARFLENHSQDLRAEDAAYLRAIALQRCGDVRGTSEAAQEYLRRYPAGFRHSELERLSRPAP